MIAAIVVLSVCLLIALLALFVIAGIFQGASGERPDGTHRAPGASIRLRSGDAQSAGDSSASRHGHPWGVTLSSDQVNDPAFGRRGAGWQKPVAPPSDDARPGGLPPAPARRRVVDFGWPPHIVASDSDFSDFLRELIDDSMRRHARAAARTPGGRP